MSSASTPLHPRTRLLAEAVVALFGFAALVWPWRADLRYCERHLLLDYYASDAGELVVARNWRIAGVVTGLALLLVVRPLVGLWAARRTVPSALGDVVRIGVALALS